MARRSRRRNGGPFKERDFLPRGARRATLNIAAATAPICIAGLIGVGIPMATAIADDETGIAPSALTFETVRALHDSFVHGSGPLPVQADATLVADNIEGAAGTPIPVKISVTGLASTDHMILAFRDLPEAVSLSSGFQSSDTWFIALNEVRSLHLIAKEDYTGKFDIRVELIRGNGMKPLSRKVHVSISAGAVPAATALAEDGFSRDRGQPARSARQDNQPKSAPISTSAGSTRLSPEKKRKLMTIAKSLLQQEDIAAARLVYARLARMGSADAAYMMAQTYDPAYLSQFQVMGMKPNPEKAKKWYNIASALGSKEAPERLSILEASGF